MNPELAEILAGTEAWVVGGTVRDELLGRGTTDVDLAVRGDPEQAARAVAAAVRGQVFRLSEGFGAWRAIEHTKSGSSFLVMAIVGGAIVPPLMGLVSDASTINLAMLIPALCFAVVYLFAWVSRRDMVPAAATAAA